MKKTLRLIALVLLTATLCLSLFSCGAAPNKDPEKAQEALEAENYRVNDITYVLKTNEDFAKLDKAIEAKGGAGMAIKDLTICYFESADAANEAWDNIQDSIELAKETSWSPDTFTSGKSGNMIWYGNEELIKIAK